MELSIREAAAHLGLSVDTVRRRVRAGALAGHKANGAWRITLDGDGPTTTTTPTTEAMVLALNERIAAQDAQLLAKDLQIDRLLAVSMQTALNAASERRWYEFWR